MFASKENKHPLFDFLSQLQHRGRQLMINKRIRSGQELEDALSLADRYLDTESDAVSLPPGILKPNQCWPWMRPTYVLIHHPRR